MSSKKFLLILFVSIIIIIGIIIYNLTKTTENFDSNCVPCDKTTQRNILCGGSCISNTQDCIDNKICNSPCQNDNLKFCCDDKGGLCRLSEDGIKNICSDCPKERTMCGGICCSSDQGCTQQDRNGKDAVNCCPTTQIQNIDDNTFICCDTTDVFTSDKKCCLPEQTCDNNNICCSIGQQCAQKQDDNSKNICCPITRRKQKSDNTFICCDNDTDVLVNDTCCPKSQVCNVNTCCQSGYGCGKDLFTNKSKCSTQICSDGTTCDNTEKGLNQQCMDDGEGGTKCISKCDYNDENNKPVFCDNSSIVGENYIQTCYNYTKNSNNYSACYKNDGCSWGTFNYDPEPIQTSSGNIDICKTTDNELYFMNPNSTSITFNNRTSYVSPIGTCSIANCIDKIKEVKSLEYDAFIDNKCGGFQVCPDILKPYTQNTKCPFDNKTVNDSRCCYDNSGNLSGRICNESEICCNNICEKLSDFTILAKKLLELETIVIVYTDKTSESFNWSTDNSVFVKDSNSKYLSAQNIGDIASFSNTPITLWSFYNDSDIKDRNKSGSLTMLLNDIENNALKHNDSSQIIFLYGNSGLHCVKETEKLFCGPTDLPVDTFQFSKSVVNPKTNTPLTFDELSSRIRNLQNNAVYYNDSLKIITRMRDSFGLKAQLDNFVICDDVKNGTSFYLQNK
jgi:hypothetical protein